MNIMYIYIYIYIHMHAPVCIHIFLYVCVHTCVYGLYGYIMIYTCAAHTQRHTSMSSTAVEFFAAGEHLQRGRGLLAWPCTLKHVLAPAVEFVRYLRCQYRK